MRILATLLLFLLAHGPVTAADGLVDKINRLSKSINITVNLKQDQLIKPTKEGNNWTKVQYNSISQVETGENAMELFNKEGQNRFKPDTAGIYLITAATAGSGFMTAGRIAIFKNGSIVRATYNGGINVPYRHNRTGLYITTFVYLDGKEDYVEIKVQNISRPGQSNVDKVAKLSKKKVDSYFQAMYLGEK